MSDVEAFTEEERRMISQFGDQERINSFSQTVWPFIFFFVPSFFLFVLFLSDGRIETGTLAYAFLCGPYFLGMHSAKQKTRLFSTIIGKYERLLRGKRDREAGGEPSGR